ncbi:Gag polyprotein [Plecturocebus cupreus]
MPPTSLETTEPGAASPEPPCPRTALARHLQSSQLALALQMPLWETQGSPTVTDDETVELGMPIFYYQPIKKPQALVDLLESISQMHQPNWDDCHQLLFTLFNTEEQRCILTEARKWLQE